MAVALCGIVLACSVVVPMVVAQEVDKNTQESEVSSQELTPSDPEGDDGSAQVLQTSDTLHEVNDGGEGSEGEEGLEGTYTSEEHGKTEVHTGDAATHSATETELNTNETLIDSSGDDSSVEIVHVNHATSSTLADVGSETGDNVASGTSATITTGDAYASANVVNVVNTNIVDSDGLMYFLDLFFGTSDLDLRELFTVYDEPSVGSTCTFDTCPEGDVTLNVVNTNTAHITNEVIVRADTGGNSATAENGDASISTGDAYASANVVNVVNTNIVDSNYLLVAINSFGDFVNDIIFPSAEFFEELFGTGAGVSSGMTVVTTNDNTATIENGVTVTSDTGNNAATTTTSGSADIVTGDAISDVNVVNQVNTNVFGDSFLILFRIHGTFSGELFGLPEGMVWKETPGGIAIMYDPLLAMESSGGLGTNETAQVTVENSNSASVSNNISVYALTGDNQAFADGTANTTTSITTGDAYASANVVNLVNTNIFGENWILAIFNIFGDFSGNIMFGMPDLWVGARAQVPQNFGAGSCFDYKITVSNLGDAVATDVFLDVVFDDSLQTISGFDETLEDGARYRLDSVGAGESQDVTIPSCLTNAVTQGHTLTTEFTVQTAVPENNLSNNTENISFITATNVPGVGQGGGGTLRLGPSKLTLTKTASVEEITASSSVDYKVTIKNTGDPVYHALLVDTIYDEKGKVLHEQRWGLETIKSDEEIEVTYTVEYAASTTPGLYRNEAFISGVDRNPDYEHNLGTPTKSPVASSTVRVVAARVEDRANTSSDVECVEYLTTPIKRGANNPVSEVLKLQYFLNAFEKFKLRLTGFYDDQTYAAVHAFQRKYASDILAPWGATETTGFVYHTTKKKVNELYCEGKREFPLSEVQAKEIDAVRRALNSMQRENRVRESEQSEETPESLINLSEIGTAAPAPENSERLLAVAPSTQATTGESADQVAAAADAIINETTGGILSELKKRIGWMFSWMGR